MKILNSSLFCQVNSLNADEQLLYNKKYPVPERRPQGVLSDFIFYREAVLTSNTPSEIMEVPKTSNYNEVVLSSIALITWNILKSVKVANTASKSNFN